MSRRLLLAILLLGLCATPLTACGSARKRPVIVATFPAQDAVLPGLIAEIEITYDEAVRVLNPNDVTVFSGGFFIPARIEPRAGSPCCIYIRPSGTLTFLSDRPHVIRIGQGAVVNRNEQYKLEDAFLSFTTGDATDIAVGSPGGVTMLDPATFVSNGSTALAEGAPASHTPLGIVGVELPAGPRFLVQNQNTVAPAVSPLHFFSPGDATTTPVVLTDGTDLRCEANTLALSRSGASGIVACTHLPSQRMRLYAVDIATGTELGFLVLSPPANAANAPLGLDIDYLGAFAYIACRDGADGRLVYVDLSDLTALSEQDRVAGTPGTQGAALLPGVGAGPIRHVISLALIADPASADTTIINANNDSLNFSPVPSAVGTSVGYLRSWDSSVFVQMLKGYTNGNGIIQRVASQSYLVPFGITISDLVGAVPSGATGIAAGARLPSPGNRFLLLLDSDVVTTFVFNGQFLLQEDLDDVEADIQCIDVSGAVTGGTAIGVAEGRYP